MKEEEISRLGKLSQPRLDETANQVSIKAGRSMWARAGVPQHIQADMEDMT